MTVQELVNYTYQKLKNNSPTPLLDAEIIVSHFIKLSKEQLVIKSKSITSTDDISKVKKAIKQRQKSKPISYITNKKEFMDNVYIVNQTTLIPRPETEELVEKVISLINQNKYKKMLEIGTGSGCISIEVVKRTKLDKALSIDISAGAIEVARKNKLSILPKEKLTTLEIIESDLFKFSSEEYFDLIVSNPPYIPTNQIEALSDNIKRYEPIIALDGGIDGQIFYNNFITLIKNNLTGHAVFEIDSIAGKSTYSLFKENLGNNFKVSIHKDISGKDRILIIETI